MTAGGVVPDRARLAVLASIAFSASLVLLAPSVARGNCGAEGCPLSTHGPEIAYGRWSVDVGYESIEQDRLWDGTHQISSADLEAGGHGETIEELTRSRTWRLNGRFRVTDRLLLSAGVPYTRREHRHSVEHHPGYFLPYTWRFAGVADASVLAQWALTGAQPGARHSLGVVAGVKLPTGRRGLEEQGGEAPEPAVRLGSGSTDAVVGANYRYGIGVSRPDGARAMLPVQLGATMRFNTRGTDDYRMGNEFQLNATAAYPLTRWAELLGQLNTSVHAADRVGTTDAEPHHTGGTSVFATPGLRVVFGGGVSAYGYAQMRVYQKTNGAQLVAPTHFIFGTSLALGR